MHVLVVCTANVARSPLAEAMLARELGDDAVVSSAGIRARTGDPAAQGSFLLAEERGLDLSEHRSRPVSAELVAASDLVLTMSEEHRDRCAPLVAGAGQRTFTLRELVRLLDGVDLTRAPDDRRERLPWLTKQLHNARPAARPAKEPEDVDDPIGRSWPRWVKLGQDLDELVPTAVRALRG